MGRPLFGVQVQANELGFRHAFNGASHALAGQTGGKRPAERHGVDPKIRAVVEDDRADPQRPKRKGRVERTGENADGKRRPGDGGAFDRLGQVAHPFEDGDGTEYLVGNEAGGCRNVFL